MSQPTASVPMPPPTSCRELLAAMVRINTVNPAFGGQPYAERPLTDYLDQLAQHWGMHTLRLPVEGMGDNLLVMPAPRKVPDADERPWVFFESHLDTVGIAGMTIDPFAAEVRGERLYGRGACDTKATGAAMLWALRRYFELPGQRNRIAVALTLCEEHQKSGAAALAETQLPQLGIRPAGVIVGEPTGNRLVTAHNGVTRWALSTVGKACHSSQPELGVSAVSAMCEVILELERRYIPSLTASHPMTGRARCSVNTIRGGSAINIIPDRCTCEIDRRIVPGEDGRAVVPAIETLLQTLQQRLPNLNWEHGPAYIDPPLDPAVSTQFAGVISATLRTLGLNGDPCGVPYGTDASNFSGEGIPAVVMGPGDIAQAHTADEWIDLRELDQAVEIYLALMNAEYDHDGA